MFFFFLFLFLFSFRRYMGLGERGVIFPSISMLVLHQVVFLCLIWPSVPCFSGRFSLSSPFIMRLYSVPSGLLSPGLHSQHFASFFLLGFPRFPSQPWAFLRRDYPVVCLYFGFVCLE